MLFCLVLYLMVTTAIKAQIQVRVLGSEELMEDFIPHYTGEFPQAYQLPEVDVEKAKEEDERAPKGYFRFGVSSDVAISWSSGEFKEIDRQTTQWQMTLQSPGALSLNFWMSEVNLPEGSEMYVYSPLSRMVQGPILMSEIPNRKLSTDLVPGEIAVLLVNMPTKAKDEFQLQINQATHGYRGQSMRGFGDSDVCNIDVNCSLPGNRTLQRDATGLALFGSIGCSGALVMNQCRDFQPYYLTAFHCVDVNTSGGISGLERAAIGNWAFRFKYESPNPVPPSCRGSEPITWIYFSGGSLASSYRNSDFALVKLQTQNFLHSDLAMAGWDRSGRTPTNTMGLHHPNLDVKKISFDYDPPVITTRSPGSNNYIAVSWNEGITAGGSSGSPLFDESGRIIGQLAGGDSECLNPQDADLYGRFYTSWVGGGSSSSGLSIPLGRGSTVNSMSGGRVPKISPSGSFKVCYGSSRTFSLLNYSGGSVTWSASPSSLVTTSSGSGTSATLSPRTSSTAGEVTLTFRTTASGCSPVFWEKKVWMGRPAVPTISPAGPTINMNLGELKRIYVTKAPGSTTSSTLWSATGSVDVFGSASGGSSKLFEGTSYGSGTYRVRTTNVCGNSGYSNGSVNISQSGGGSGGIFKVSISPNPAHDEIKVEFPTDAIEMRRDVFLMDVQGKVVMEMSSVERNFSMPLDKVATGVYLLRISAGDQVWSERIVVE